MKKIIDKLYETQNLDKDQLLYLLDNMTENTRNYLNAMAHKTRVRYHGNLVDKRGLIEFTNYCTKECLHCSLRAENKEANRFRLTLDQILHCCDTGYENGYRNFILQGGEDDYFTDDKIVDMVYSIKNKYSDCAITLSIGEKSYDSYKKYLEAGVTRYLLRLETSSEELYESLHPKMNLKTRLDCLDNIKSIGYELETSFRVGLPGYTNEDYVNDILLLKKLEPSMIGIGPFIPHDNTPFKNSHNGTVSMTMAIIGIVRLLLPQSLIPATYALDVVEPLAKEKALQFGANVLVPRI